MRAASRVMFLAALVAVAGCDDDTSKTPPAAGDAVAPTMTVLYVGGEDGRPPRPLVDALRAERIAVSVVGTASCPLGPAGFKGYDALILDDLPGASLGEAQQRAVALAVSDLGLGLVMIGGDHSFGAGGWRDTPIETALPVSVDVRDEGKFPAAALVVIAGPCGFPDADRWMGKLCQIPLDSLSGKDRFGILRAGPDGVESVVPLQAVTNKSKLRATAKTVTPGDSSQLAPLFDEALGAFAGAPAPLMTILVLSDGSAAPPGPELIAKCHEARIQCTTITVGAAGGEGGARHEALKALTAKLRGQSLYADDSTKLPRLFARASQSVARSFIVPGEIVPVAAAECDLLEGLGGLPPLLEHALVEARPRAEVLLTSPRGDPILARWKYGEGRAVAFTSSAGAPWAPGWPGWTGFKPFWSRVVRWSARK